MVSIGILRAMLPLAAVALLSGCGAESQTAATAKPVLSPISGVRAAVGSCMIEPLPEVVIPADKEGNMRMNLALVGPAASLAVIAAQQAYNALGTAIKNAAEEKTYHAQAVANVEALEDGEMRKGKLCVQFVRGDFSAKPESDPAWRGQTGLNPTQYQRLANNGLGTSGLPDFIAEFAFRPSLTDKVFAVAPTYVLYNEPIGTRFLRFGKDRTFTLSLVFHEPDKEATDESLPNAQLVLGELQAGRHTFFPRLQPVRATVKDKDGKDTTVVRFPAVPGESAWIQLESASKPISVTVTSFEKEEKSAALSAAGTFFDSSKDTVNNELERLLSKEKREQIRNEKLKARLALDQQYRTALNGAVAELKKCAEDGGIASANAAISAMKGANAAAVAAGEKLPFKDLFEPGDRTKNKEGCKKLHDLYG